MENILQLFWNFYTGQRDILLQQQFFFCVWLIGQEAVAKVPRGIHEKPQTRTGITDDGTSESCEKKDIDDRWYKEESKGVGGKLGVEASTFLSLRESSTTRSDGKENSYLWYRCDRALPRDKT